MTATAERYARATRSSHLRMTEEPGDADTLVAAGLAHESLGVSLLRLRAQYDATSRTPANNTLTEHLLILMQLPGLAATSEQLCDYAIRQAERRNIIELPQDMRRIVGLVLDAFLDPMCHPCGGRGFTGEFGSPMLRCAVCRESGKRRIAWGDVAHMADFGMWLLDDMGHRMDLAEHQIRRKLRDSD